MIKFYYPNGEYCYRALHTVHAVYYDEQNKLIARVSQPDDQAYKEVEISAFELVETGRKYS